MKQQLATMLLCTCLISILLHKIITCNYTIRLSIHSVSIGQGERSEGTCQITNVMMAPTLHTNCVDNWDTELLLHNYTVSYVSCGVVWAPLI